MEEELVEHIVDIDQYVSVTLKIPKVMTALELKGLTMKANKLFNLAEVPIVQEGSKGLQRLLMSGISIGRTR